MKNSSVTVCIVDVVSVYINLHNMAKKSFFIYKIFFTKEF